MSAARPWSIESRADRHAFPVGKSKIDVASKTSPTASTPTSGNGELSLRGVGDYRTSRYCLSAHFLLLAEADLSLPVPLPHLQRLPLPPRPQNPPNPSHPLDRRMVRSVAPPLPLPPARAIPPQPLARTLLLHYHRSGRSVLCIRGPFLEEGGGGLLGSVEGG